MSILIDKSTKVLVQGITGSEGSFHSEQMLEYGTDIVAGVTPGKGGLKAVNDKVPVFNSVKEAISQTEATASIIFVPPAFASEAILESVYAGIKVIVCISEGVPGKNMIEVKALCKQKNVILIGPNCPGIITVDECKLGIMPGFICKKGDIGIISKSGTLTYEAIDQIVKNNMGITTAIGIGGDPIIGTSMKDALKMFEKASKTKGIELVMGEIVGFTKLFSKDVIANPSNASIQAIDFAMDLILFVFEDTRFLISQNNSYSFAAARFLT